MATTTVLFDLDGTLLPMDQDRFTDYYFKRLAEKAALIGYEPKLLIKTVWTGISAMVGNDGSCTNEQAFWNIFAAVYGRESLSHKSFFDEFYSNEFDNIKEVCGYNPEARRTVDLLKTKGVRLVLATNPIFPAAATQSRIRWAGLEVSDFELYTTYENSGYCKPNPKYYLEILKKIGADPHSCIMVGNNVTEDMVARTLGMKVFLLTDCIINEENKDISVYPHGGFTELKEFLTLNC